MILFLSSPFKKRGEVFSSLAESCHGTDSQTRSLTDHQEEWLVVRKKAVDMFIYSEDFSFFHHVNSMQGNYGGVEVPSSQAESCQCTDSQTLQDICSLFGGEVWRSLKYKLFHQTT